MMKEPGMIPVTEESRTFGPPETVTQRSRIKSMEEYQKMYRASLDDPQGFWGAYAGELVWTRPWDRVLEDDFQNGKVKWFVGGKLNAATNCLDRHLHTPRKDKVAILWEGESGQTKTYTYQQLHAEVCRFANALRSLGVRKGDRVAISLPMVPELPIAMLACARIGAVHSVVFNRFGPESLRERIIDCGATVLITSNVRLDGGKILPSKRSADLALKGCPCVRSVIVVPRIDQDVEMVQGRDILSTELMAREGSPTPSDPEIMDAEDPLFILYTSGSTGKPKGVVHSTAGYLLHTKKSFEWVFDIKDEDLFWCAEDISWITGHSYGVYGPLCSGATLLMFEGTFSYPQPDRLWEIVAKHKVTVFYTTPAVLRSCRKQGDEWPQKHDLSSLRLLGSVGEPILPETWIWYHQVIGKGRCPIVDTWWQTETGGILIAPLPGAMPLKPGSAALPFFGADPAVLREDGSECELNEGGYLVLRKPWPGIMRMVHGDPQGFKRNYFSQFPGAYFTGDGARKDEDGYFWLLGRVDDVIRSSGYRLGTTEIENVLVSHEAVAEAAVVGFPHELKGQGIYAFVTLRPGFEKTDVMKKTLLEHVQRKIGPLATPDKIQLVDVLSKTLSGKIMRRILRKIAAGDIDDLGDTSTLADPSVVQDLLRGRQ